MNEQEYESVVETMRTSVSQALVTVTSSCYYLAPSWRGAAVVLKGCLGCSCPLYWWPDSRTISVCELYWM